MSSTHVPRNGVEVQRKSNEWGDYLKVVSRGIEQSFAIIDGTVLTGGNTDEEIVDAIENEGYDTSP